MLKATTTQGITVKNYTQQLVTSLLSATAKAVIGFGAWEPSDVTDRAWHFTPSVGRVTALIVVKRADLFSVFSGFSCFSMNGNFCVTVGIPRLGTNLSAGLLLSSVTHKDSIFTAATPPWTGASSAGSSGRHVKRLPAQVVQWVFVVTRHKEALGQAAIAVEDSETRRFPCFVEYSFQFGNLKRQLNISTLGWLINLFFLFFPRIMSPKADSRSLSDWKQRINPNRGA